MCRKCERGTTFPQRYKKGDSVVIAPGYVLSRTKSNVAVSLCDEFFNRIHPPKPFVSRPASENQTEQLVTDLQKQITQLVHLLEEESVKQMTIVNRFQSEGKETNLMMQRKHEEEQRKVMETNALEIEELHNNYGEMMEEQKQKAEKELSELTIQFDNVQAAFVSYKETIIEEMNERWAQQENEMKEKYKAEMRTDLTLQKSSLQHKCDEEKQAIQEDFEKQIASILEKHKEEMEDATEQYNAVLESVLELKKSKLEIQDLQDKLEKKTEELRNQAQYLSHVEAQLEQNQSELAKIKGTYVTDIGTMERKYEASIKALEDQNIDLKQLFALKAEELCALKAAIQERERIQQLQKNTSIQKEHARDFATISPAMPESLQPASPPASQKANKPED
ncbi:flagellum-associated coiled-coil domain-containing protein 1-like isoform X1 [Heterodontus francisci]|uniref:flagellum-associated coiled-coil domain-containing protein 1-like isoform X1 n=1 Tax=Heterodontus francisci TaxID=7792 RepID=UPI00355C7D6A